MHLASGVCICVRPIGNPQGTKLFSFEWDRPKLSMTVVAPASGELVSKVPGRWGPRAPFNKARGVGKEQIWFFGFSSLSARNQPILQLFVR